MTSLVTIAEPFALLWLAVEGRLAYFTHLVSGHRVAWKRVGSDAEICPGDVVCDDCGQVLWCRAHDVWRSARASVKPDHWGATRTGPSTWTVFESLQRVLQLADACPRSPEGDAVRRAACELVEAETATERRVRRRRMLRAVTRLERWQARHSLAGDEGGVKRLTEALRDEI